MIAGRLALLLTVGLGSCRSPAGVTPSVGSEPRMVGKRATERSTVPVLSPEDVAVYRTALHYFDGFQIPNLVRVSAEPLADADIGSAVQSLNSQIPWQELRHSLLAAPREISMLDLAAYTGMTPVQPGAENSIALTGIGREGSWAYLQLTTNRVSSSTVAVIVQQLGGAFRVEAVDLLRTSDVSHR
jgi:hypothetical protein